jgi:2-polyprenyl-3-methyl-5-hydroxy-6-metoxy-1,4-benzoquinol methylase
VATTVSESKHLSIDREVARRIESERQYHDKHYRELNTPIALSFDLADSKVKKPHNLYWTYYETIRNCLGGQLRGKRFLVVGCGDGVVALNLAKEGAIVDAFDLSTEAVELCKKRAEFHGTLGARFFVSSCEELDLADESYDAIVGEMILHHIDIPSAMRQFHRLLRPGGVGAFAEWKQYPVVDRVRSIPLVRRLLPPGGVDGYCTEYERKLTNDDFRTIRNVFPDMELTVRYCLRGKVQYFFPKIAARLEPFDYRLLRTLPFLKPFTDGVVIQFSKSVAREDT